jgi:hypothetical protein
MRILSLGCARRVAPCGLAPAVIGSLLLLQVLCILSALPCTKAACKGQKAACKAGQVSVCIKSTVWACVPAAAEPQEPCGGLYHGGADAAARRCPAGYDCSRQDSWWWFCKPTPNDTKPVVQQPQKQQQQLQPANGSRTTGRIKPVSVNTSAAGVTYRRYSAMVSGRVLVRDVASLSDNGAEYQYGPETFDNTRCVPLHCVASHAEPVLHRSAAEMQST